MLVQEGRDVAGSSVVAADRTNVNLAPVNILFLAVVERASRPQEAKMKREACQVYTFTHSAGGSIENVQMYKHGTLSGRYLIGG